MTALGQLIREGRIKKGLSQPKLAALLGLQSDSQINRWELGKQRIHFPHLGPISRILELDYDEVCRAWLKDLETALVKKRKELLCTQNK